MARPHIEFTFSQALAWRKGVSLAGRADAQHKLLSGDDESGELTCLMRFPAGWSADVVSRFEEEVYVLDGALLIGGAALTRDGYFRVPPDVEHRWTATTEVVVLLFLNAPSDADTRELVVIDTPAMNWDRSGIPPELDYMGLARKALFTDWDTGRYRTWLLANAPQIAPRGACLAVETHSCVEELFMLSGDIIGPQGAMTPGAYFWRPRDTLHGPFGSRNGGLAIFRWRHGVQDTTFHEQARAFDFEVPYRPDLPPGMLIPAPPDTGARY